VAMVGTVLTAIGHFMAQGPKESRRRTNGTARPRREPRDGAGAPPAEA